MLSWNRWVSCVTKLSISRRFGRVDAVRRLCPKDGHAALLHSQKRIKQLEQRRFAAAAAAGDADDRAAAGCRTDTSCENRLARRRRSATCSAAAPVKSTVRPAGDVLRRRAASSRMSSTRLPAAKVFCKVLPRLASATHGAERTRTAQGRANERARRSQLPARYSAARRDAAWQGRRARMAVSVTPMFAPVRCA